MRMRWALLVVFAMAVVHTAEGQGGNCDSSDDVDGCGGGTICSANESELTDGTGCTDQCNGAEGCSNDKVCTSAGCKDATPAPTIPNPTPAPAPTTPAPTIPAPTTPAPTIPAPTTLAPSPAPSGTPAPISAPLTTASLTAASPTTAPVTSVDPVACSGSDDCGANQTCNSGFCDCDEDFEFINEGLDCTATCAEEDDVCGANQTCNNDLCECDGGFEFTDAGLDCTATCPNGVNDCGDNQTCNNDLCECDEGFELTDGGSGCTVTCAEEDGDCGANQTCTEDDCGANQTCTEDGCECDDGFEFTDEGLDCRATCTEEEDDCGANQTCTSGLCECDDDFEFTADGGLNCTAVTSAGAEDTADTESVVGLAVSLSALLLANLLCAGWFFVCGKKKRQAPSRIPNDPNTDAELGRLQKDLETEHNRRVKAEALIHRSKGGGIRPGDFPSVRDVQLHVEQLPGDALAWTQSACAVDRSNAGLRPTIQSVLQNSFIVCREEVKRCLDERLRNLSAFLGNDEPVVLSGGDSMNLDTQYVLYECLCKNYKTIVPAGPEDMERLAGVVQRRCGGSADATLVNEVIFSDDTWPSFEALMSNYLMVFVEMDLQKPRMDFEDTLGMDTTFDPRIHRDWSPHLKVPDGQQCSIVFPAIRLEKGRPKSNAKMGVVRIPGNGTY